MQRTAPEHGCGTTSNLSIHTLTRCSFVVIIALIAAAGCRSRFGKLDETAKRELAECPRYPKPEVVSPPPGEYRAQGITLDYDKLVPLPDPYKNVDNEYSEKTVSSPKRLEQLYHDATHGNVRAAWFTCPFEVGARNLGRDAARYLATLQCQAVYNCEIRFDKLPFSRDTASGHHILAMVGAEFERKATELQILQGVVADALTLLVGIRAATAVNARATHAVPRDRAGKGCFTAGTLIATAGGFVPIDELNESDRVLSLNETTHRIETRRVLGISTRTGVEIVELSVAISGDSVETIQTTAEHPFWVDERGWVRAGDLEPGDRLRSRSHADVTVIRVHATDRVSTVYNIEVEEFQTYFVGRSEVWVHNKPMKSRRGKRAPRRPPSTLRQDVPPAGSDAFASWFDDLTPRQFMKYWNDKSTPKHVGARDAIERAMRHPGGYHEWLKVSQTPRLKRWGVRYRQIQEARNLTKETLGKKFRHGTKGSKRMHDQLDEMFNASRSFRDFLGRLNSWADRELVAGRADLPASLRLVGP